MIEGFNTDVRHRGRVYHVQSQPSFHPKPALETTVFVGGEVLVRLRSTLANLAGPTWNLSDQHHALELQHWNLVRKIRHGMLDEEPSRGCPEPVATIAGGVQAAVPLADAPAAPPLAGLPGVSPRREPRRWRPRLAVIVRW